VVADLTQHAGIVKLANEATSFNANILINGLGVNKLSVIEATSDDDVNHILTTNLHTPINVCRALLPLLKGQTNASIINIGSILGSIGYAGSTLYCASKFGLRGFTESLRRELADSNINVVYFAPRATNTELNSDEMSKMNDELGNAVDSPDWVAQQLINVLIADKSVNRYLGWPEKFFVRLNALLPSLVDNALSKQLATIKRYCKIAQSG
jgi:short-subunit dehydrogenase